MVIINGSPYTRDGDDARLALVRRRAAELGAPVAYVNYVGGQDELVYEGDSMLVLPDGTLAARAPQWQETLLVADVSVPGGRTVDSDPAVDRYVLGEAPVPAYEPVPAPVAERLDDRAEVWGALVTGLRDFVRKNDFETVLLGLSGGIDSAVTAALACDALGAANVYGVSNPSDYSSTGSVDDATELARRTGLNFTLIPIAPMVRAYTDAHEARGLTEENLQARVRAVIWTALANQHHHIVLACGNKSECAVGYSTVYGDAVGGFAPLRDVPKTLVWELARWRNAEAVRRGETPPIPENSITKHPSAELRPGQVDTDSLPPYEELDAILADYVDRDLSSDALIARGHDPAVVQKVVRLVDGAEHKRRQYPPGTKISLKAFGRDRRLPISNRWRTVVRTPTD
jgi:NAD+ synthase (glutamine-hydrolysing)